MDDTSTRTILQIASIFLGGGAVQIVVAIFRRRSELKEIDARAESLTASVQDQLTQRLAEENVRQAERAVVMEQRLEEMRARLGNERKEVGVELAACVAENERLNRQVASLRLDLEDTRMQIARLERPPPRAPRARA